MMRFAFALLVVLGLCEPTLGAAPTIPAWERDEIRAHLEDFSEAWRKAYPSFQLNTKLRDFPAPDGRRPFKITLEFADPPSGTNLTVRDTPPTIATIHHPRSGRPLANCSVPCTLEVPTAKIGALIVYRSGSVPISMRPVGSKAEERAEASTRVVPRIYNAYDAAHQRETCRAEAQTRLAKGGTVDAEPCFRVPPSMPRGVKRSGHCRMRYTVQPDGTTAEVTQDGCTDVAFCGAATEAVKRWFFHPAMQNGKAAARPDRTSKVSFRLSRKSGEVLDAPEDELVVCEGPEA